MRNFNEVVDDYLKSGIDAIELAKTFFDLAELTYDVCGLPKINKELFVEQAVVDCFKKLPEYDKESARSFFARTILKSYRKQYKLQKSYDNLKIKYKQWYAKENKNGSYC